jgi:hypothetical protein
MCCIIIYTLQTVEKKYLHDSNFPYTGIFHTKQQFSLYRYISYKTTFFKIISWSQFMLNFHIFFISSRPMFSAVFFYHYNRQPWCNWNIVETVFCLVVMVFNATFNNISVIVWYRSLQVYQRSYSQVGHRVLSDLKRVSLLKLSDKCPTKSSQVRVRVRASHVGVRVSTLR